MTLYTSDTNSQTKKAVKTALVYLIVSLLLACFGAIYEHFSHEVYSYYMIFAFAFPLAGGALPFLMLSILPNQRYPLGIASNLYHSGIATLTVSSIMRGILDIYGTTNSLVSYYWKIGIVLLLVALIIHIIPVPKET